MTDPTSAQKLQRWLDFSESNRPGYDSLSAVSYGVAPIKRVWLEDVLSELTQLEADKASLIKQLESAVHKEAEARAKLRDAQAQALDEAAEDLEQFHSEYDAGELVRNRAAAIRKKA